VNAEPKAKCEALRVDHRTTDTDYGKGWARRGKSGERDNEK